MTFLKKKTDKEVEKFEKLTPAIAGIYVLLFAFSILIMSPLVIVLSSSLREASNMKSPLILFSQVTLSSYVTAFERMNYPMQFLNSLMTTGGSVIVVVFIATMAAYPITRIKRPLSKGLYYFFIAGLVIPAQMVIVPIAQMFGRLNIPNTRFYSNDYVHNL